MKKIVCILLFTMLLTGIAFAEVSFSHSVDTVTSGLGNRAIKFDSLHTETNFTISNDYAGAALTLETTSATDANLVAEFTEYYGWMNFDFGLSFQMGEFSMRDVAAVDNDSRDINTFEVFNYGTLFGSGLDITNLGYVDYTAAGEGKLALVAGYALKDIIPGELTLKASLLEGDWGTKDTNTMKSGFGFQVRYAMEDLFAATVIYKNILKDPEAYSFGFFGEFFMIEPLLVTAGFTKDESGFAIDCRARYAVNEKIAVTNMNKYQKFDEESLGSYIYSMLNVGYKITENVNGNFMIALDSFLDDNGLSTLLFVPSVDASIGEHTLVTMGLESAITDFKADNKTFTVQVPVSVKVEF